MAKTKNQNGSSKFHLSRARIKSSRLARNKKVNRTIFKSTRRTILTIILMAMLIVILSVLLSIFTSPEHLVKRRVESIASYYYENFFYPQLASDGASFNKNMERYSKSGLSRLSVRQLLLFDDGHYSGSSDLIMKYCDENETSIQIYPDSPFGPTDYHVDYHYACTF